MNLNCHRIHNVDNGDKKMYNLARNCYQVYLCLPEDDIATPDRIANPCWAFYNWGEYLAYSLALLANFVGLILSIWLGVYIVTRSRRLLDRLERRADPVVIWPDCSPTSCYSCFRAPRLSPNHSG